MGILLVIVLYLSILTTEFAERIRDGQEVNMKMDLQEIDQSEKLDIDSSRYKLPKSLINALLKLRR